MGSGGSTEPVVRDMYIVGAGYRDADHCPVCKSSYRTRLVKLYLDEKTDLSKEMSVLHIAPEEQLAYILKHKKNIEYVSGDLSPERYSHLAPARKIDVTSIGYNSDFFDLIICNHVLEHIPDDLKAMEELYRVLKPGGKAILQVPVSLKLDHTYEDPSIVAERDRLKYFGQKDHVRIYGQDYYKRLSEAGFRVELYDPFSESTFPGLDKLELDRNEHVIVGRKY